MVTRRNIFASLLVSASSISASAAIAAAPTWQGPYIGIYSGGAIGSNQVTTDAGTVTGTSYFTSSTDIAAVNSAGSTTKHPTNMIAGVQAGHDWLWRQVAYGMVLDYTVLPLSSDSNVSKQYAGSTDTYSIYTAMSTNWLLTLRGRLGYINQTLLRWPSLLYATGGMAITKLRVNNNFRDNSSLAATGGGNNAENQIGWTAGVGIEIASFEHLSVEMEYLFVKVPSVKATNTITNSAAGFGIPAQSQTSPFTTTGDFHANVFKIGLNYRFD